MNFKMISVGIADLKIASSPDILRTILGSCVGICLYDPGTTLAGLSHIMLPTKKSDTITKDRKYADVAIPAMMEEMIRMGASRERIVAKITGGATMFKLSENSLMGEIGKNNITKVREVLKELGIAILAEDLGGDYGRTIDFYTESGILKIKSLGKPEKSI